MLDNEYNEIENYEDEPKTRKTKKMNLFDYIIVGSLLLVLLIGIIYFISASINNITSNGMPNNRSFLDVITRYNFNDSYIVNIEEAKVTDNSIPFISSQRTINVNGDIQNTKKKNNYNIILEVYNKSNTQVIETQNIKRVLTRNQIYKFSFTAYVNEEVGNYGIKIEPF